MQWILRSGQSRRPRWSILLGTEALLCLALTSCRRPSTKITFTQVPKTSLGGADTSGVISGRVTGPAEGSRILLYARSGGKWWIQPYGYIPYTVIAADGSWSNSSHLGTDYAAVLTKGDYDYQKMVPELPKVGGKILAVAITAASKNRFEPTRVDAATIHFGGYEWEVRSTISNNGGIDHQYLTKNVWLDSDGALHLRVSRVGTKAACAEIHTIRNLGYGTYRFTVQDVGKLDASASLGFFTWSDRSPDQNYREMDIHISRMGNPENKNGEYLIQPYYIPANVYRFEIPSGEITASFHWMPGSAVFTTAEGSNPHAKPVSTWTFTAGIPASSGENTYINFCEFPFAKVGLRQEAEVVIENFQFWP